MLGQQGKRQGFLLFLILTLMMAGCGGSSSGTGTSEPSSTETATTARQTTVATPAPSVADTDSPGATTQSPDVPQVSEETVSAGPEPDQVRTDYAAFGANEMGRIPVVMFHRFVEDFAETTDNQYTCTYTQLEALLQTLYDQGFRLVNMDEFMDGRIAVPAGKKPVVFTFDDGTPSQFSLIKVDGQLTVNPVSAVGILLAFAEKHPDFGIAGTFCLNMDVNFFAGEGTKEERLRFLLDLGYDIGTHTWGHVDFTAKGTPADVQQALGRNQKALWEILPDVSFRTLALPYGSRPKDKTVRPLLGEGTWEGVAYQNTAALAVGAGPALPVYHSKFDSLYIARVRATGKVSVEADLDWWLANAGAKTWYVSDGNPDTLVLPASQEEFLSSEKSAPDQVIVYEPTGE